MGSDHETSGDCSMFYAKGIKDHRGSPVSPKVIEAETGMIPDMHNLALWIQSADQSDSDFIQVTPDTLDNITGNEADGEFLGDSLEPFSGFKRGANSRLTELTIWHTILKQAIASAAAGAPTQPQRKATKAGVLALK